MDGPLASRRAATIAVAPADNPFRARRIRPGAIPLFLSNGITLKGLADQLRDLGFRAQIIGPHGSGKSTLMRYLVTQLRDEGRAVTAVSVHGRPCPAVWRQLWHHSGRQDQLLAVDGWEQLTRFQRCRLRWRQRDAGLLVTAHASMGLPTLRETAVTLPLVQHVVQFLLTESNSLEITPSPVPVWHEATLHRLILRHQGNLRELLFALFDAYPRMSELTGSVGDA